MSAKYLTKSEFAKHCGVSPTSIHRGCATGNILVSSNGFINANSVHNRTYRKNAIARKEKTASGRKERRNLADKRPDLLGEIGPPAEPEKPMEPEQNQGPINAPAIATFEDRTEIDYAIEKMRSTTAINKARLAEMVKATIRRDFVDKVISLIGTCINDHLITLGDRLSPDLAAIAGTTEPATIRKIKEILDDDISVALEEMKLVVEMKYKEQLQ